MKCKEAFIHVFWIISWVFYWRSFATLGLYCSSCLPMNLRVFLFTVLTILTLLITELWLRRLWIASFTGFCLMPISRFGWQNRDKPLLRHELAEIIEWIKSNQVEYVANTGNWMLSNWKKHSVASHAAGLPLQIIRWLRFSRCLVFCCVQHPGIFSR